MTAFAGRGLSNRAPVARSQDFNRVQALPVRDLATAYPAGLVDRLSDLCATDAGRAKGVRLREVQAKALYDLGTYKQGFFPMRVGSGKTLVTFLGPRMVGAARPMLLTRASLIQKTDREWKREAADWKVSQQLRMMSYELLGRVSGAAHLDKHKPDMIIADECFTGDALVRTSTGVRPIGDILPGEYVWSLGEQGPELQRVTGVGESLTDEVYQVRFAGAVYHCTEGHPWLTRRGWVNAADLFVGDQILRDVRPAVHVAPMPEAEILRSTLYVRESCATRRPFGDSDEDSDAPAPQDERDVAAGDAGEGVRGFEGDGASTERAWRQRPGPVDPAGTFARRFGFWLDVRETLSVGRECDTCVAGGHSARECANCGGSRRRESLDDRRARTGRTEAPVLGGVGVDRVESVERICLAQHGGRRSVYNLHVENTNNYILAGGHVVHNCQFLKNRRAAVTRRVERYMKANPKTIFVPLTGTMMKKSVKDFAHLLEWSHGQSSCLPLYAETLLEWSEALDEGLNMFQVRQPGVLLDLMPSAPGWSVPPGEDDSNKTARRVFQKRLNATAGVVISDTTEDFTGSLIIEALEYTPNATTDANFKILRETCCRPDGWALAEAMHVWAVARQLALGLHYRWDPDPPQEWLDARKAWAAFVRETLAHPSSTAAGIDSELQVANAVARGDLDDEYGVLEEWRRLKPTFTIDPKDVWHDDTALNVCADWITKHPRGIVWCEHQFFARTLSRMTGIPYYGAQGLDAKGNRIDDPENPYVGPVIASIAANSTGRNLQDKWSDNLVTAPMADSERWEQLLARTHRPGQTEDTVTVDVLMGCREHLESIPRALASSDIKKDLLGFSQKLRIADLIWPEGAGRRGSRWE